MKPFLLVLVGFLLASSDCYAQDENKIETIAVVEIIDDNLTVIDQDSIALNSVYKKINQLFEASKINENAFPSVTLVVNPNVAENTIENIKYQIRSTPIKLINLQRKTITNYDGIEVSQNVLDQYNSLINYWNSLEPEARFYRENDLKFIQSVALNMTMNQRIRNKKLPGYLPFVKKEGIVGFLSMLKVDPNQSYRFVYKQDTLDKDQAFKNYKDKTYILKRRILDEQKVMVIELMDN